MSADRYPIGTAAEMARIPPPARERMLAELPAILGQLPLIEDALPEMARTARQKLPWWFRWAIPERALEAGFRRQLTTKLVWIDDDKGTGSINVRMREGEEPFYSRTVNIADGGAA